MNAFKSDQAVLRRTLPAGAAFVIFSGPTPKTHTGMSWTCNSLQPRDTISTRFTFSGRIQRFSVQCRRGVVVGGPNEKVSFGQVTQHNHAGYRVVNWVAADANDLTRLHIGRNDRPARFAAYGKHDLGQSASNAKRIVAPNRRRKRLDQLRAN